MNLRLTLQSHQQLSLRTAQRRLAAFMAVATVALVASVAPTCVKAQTLPTAEILIDDASDVTIGALDSRNHVTENSQDARGKGPGSASVGTNGVGETAQPGYAHASTTLLYLPAPSLSVHADSGVTGIGRTDEALDPFLFYGKEQGDADINLYYYFEISGPGSSINLDVHAVVGIGSPDVRTGSSGTGGAGLFVRDAAGNTTFEDVLGYNAVAMSPTRLQTQADGLVHSTLVSYTGFTDNVSIQFRTGVIYQVELGADAEAITDGSPSSQFAAAAGDAFIDPTFTIDSTMPGASAYRISFSDGIGNREGVIPVPEPATWAMLVFGLAGVGWRRGRGLR